MIATTILHELAPMGFDITEESVILCMQAHDNDCTTSTLCRLTVLDSCARERSFSKQHRRCRRRDVQRDPGRVAAGGSATGGGAAGPLRGAARRAGGRERLDRLRAHGRPRLRGQTHSPSTEPARTALGCWPPSRLLSVLGVCAVTALPVARLRVAAGQGWQGCRQGRRLEGRGVHDARKPPKHDLHVCAGGV